MNLASYQVNNFRIGGDSGRTANLEAPLSLLIYDAFNPNAELLIFWLT
jgi:hypothetical protein